jgi:hypothetical protein
MRTHGTGRAGRSTLRDGQISARAPPHERLPPPRYEVTIKPSDAVLAARDLPRRRSSRFGIAFATGRRGADEFLGDVSPIPIADTRANP